MYGNGQRANLQHLALFHRMRVGDRRKIVVRTELWIFRCCLAAAKRLGAYRSGEHFGATQFL